MNFRFGAVHPEIAMCIWSLADYPAGGMYGSMAKGTRAPSHHSGPIPHPSTEPQHCPAGNSETAKHEARAGLVLLVGASYHKLLNSMLLVCCLVLEALQKLLCL